MTSSLTRGPLRARVYWTRRVVVLVAALVLVFGIAKVLTLGSDGSSKPPVAAQVAAEPTRPTSSSASPDSPSATRTKQHPSPGKGKTSQAPVLAEPDGPCADEDIAVTPEVKKPVAGRDVFFVLHLSTLESEACTWRVSPETLTLKISSGKDDIWSSRQCPRAVPAQQVVVRKAVSTTVGVTWNGKRSDEDCSRLTEWALPGYYHVTVAALAGEPADEQFELNAPTATVVTTSPSPTPRGHKHNGRPGTSPSSSAH